MHILLEAQMSELLVALQAVPHTPLMVSKVQETSALHESMSRCLYLQSVTQPESRRVQIGELEQVEASRASQLETH